MEHLNGWPCFALAIKNGIHGDVESFLRDGTLNPNEFFEVPSYPTPLNALRLAVDCGRAEVVELLLKFGARASAASFPGCQDAALNAACRKLKAKRFREDILVPIINSLIIHGARIDSACPCHLENHEDLPMFCMKHIENVMLRKEFLNTVLNYLNGENINNRDDKGNSLIHLIVREDEDISFKTRKVFERLYYDEERDRHIHIQKMMDLGANLDFTNPILDTIQKAVSLNKRKFIEIFNVPNVNMSTIKLEQGYLEGHTYSFNFLESTRDILRIINILYDEIDRENEEKLIQFFLSQRSSEINFFIFHGGSLYEEYTSSCLELAEYENLEWYFFLVRTHGASLLPFHKFYNIIKFSEFYVEDRKIQLLEKWLKVENHQIEFIHNDKVQKEVSKTKEFVLENRSEGNPFTLNQLLKLNPTAAGQVLNDHVIERIIENLQNEKYQVLDGIIKAHLSKSLLTSFFRRVVVKYIHFKRNSLVYIAFLKLIERFTLKEIDNVLKTIIHGEIKTIHYILYKIHANRLGLSNLRDEKMLKHFLKLKY